MIMFTFPEAILSILFGPEYVTGALTMQILSIGVLFFTIGTIDQAAISGIGKPKEVTIILLIASLFNVITNIIFIPRWGMEAAAATTTISYFLIALLSSRTLWKYNLSPFPFLRWLSVGLLAFAFVLTAKLVTAILTLNIYLEALLAFLVGGMIYLLLSFLFGMVHISELQQMRYTLFRKKKS